jgi:hypothetical protein
MDEPSEFELTEPGYLTQARVLIHAFNRGNREGSQPRSKSPIVVTTGEDASSGAQTERPFGVSLFSFYLAAVIYLKIRSLEGKQRGAD